MPRIHASAVVEDGATIADGVEIGPLSVIGPEVTIGEGCRIHPHVIITGQTTLGPGCEVYPFAALGEPPQDVKYAGEPTRLEIGARALIREHVTIHRGTPQGGAITRIGDDCFLMVNVHVAHDCAIGNKVIVINQASLAGHCEIGDHAVVGPLSAMQQYTRIGKHAFITGMSGLATDVIPFGVAKGLRGGASLTGLNLVGMKRRGFSRDDIRALREAFRMIFDGPTSEIQSRAARAGEMLAGCTAVADLVDFIRARPDRNLCLPRQSGAEAQPELA